MNEHFLQSEMWKKFQIGLGRKNISRREKSFSYETFVEIGRFSRRLYCPYGPTLRSKEGLSEATTSLIADAKRTGVDFVRIEPQGMVPEKDLKKLGFYRAPREANPSHTVVNDVSGGHEVIDRHVSQSVRRYARKAEQAGLEYSVSYDPDHIEFFIDMIHDVAGRTGMRPRDDSYFILLARELFPEKAAGLFLAELDGKKVATILFFCDGDTVCYAHAASYQEYRSLSPATGLGLFALHQAYNMGCKAFDWYGVAPEGAGSSHSWTGFTQFKMGFGGERINRCGTWELPIRKSRYRIYRLLTFLARE